VIVTFCHKICRKIVIAPHDKNLIARLQAARKFPALASRRSRTKRYQSVIDQ